MAGVKLRICDCGHREQIHTEGAVNRCSIETCSCISWKHRPALDLKVPEDSPYLQKEGALLQNRGGEKVSPQDSEVDSPPAAESSPDISLDEW